MVGIERDSTMLVTMTKGDLAAMVGRIVEERITEAVERITATIEDADRRKRSSDTVVGTRAIAEVVGCNVNTLYKELARNPRLKAAVRFIGNKRIADRGELLAALREG